jgi:flagellar hook-basal body complex protein FliE
MIVSAVGTEAYAQSLTAGMLQLNSAGTVAGAAKGAQESAGGFQQFLASALDQTVKLQSQAGEATQQFLTGEADDLHKVMIAQEKAGLAFQLTLQVRNKMVEAYQEVMRMQI